MANKEDLKVLQKCYDMILYGYTALRQYPKSERHRMKLNYASGKNDAFIKL